MKSFNYKHRGKKQSYKIHIMYSIIVKSLHKCKTVVFFFFLFLSPPSPGLAKMTGALEGLFRFLQLKGKFQNLNS